MTNVSMRGSDTRESRKSVRMKKKFWGVWRSAFVVGRFEICGKQVGKVGEGKGGCRGMFKRARKVKVQRVGAVASWTHHCTVTHNGKIGPTYGLAWLLSTDVR